MDTLSYRGLPFRIIWSHPWIREAIHDETTTDYHWTKWSANMILTYNPAAASFPSVAGNVIPNARAGIFPPETDASIRRFLENPRGRLIVTSGGDVVLSSPNSPVATSDANRGPICRVNSIQELWGTRTWQMNVEWETYIREDPVTFTILSNRWAIETDTGENRLTKRLITGSVTCRMDELLRNNTPIDTLRAQFAGHSCPMGFKRVSVRAIDDPGGNSCRYWIVDQEQMYSQPVGGATGFKIYVEDKAWQFAGSLTRAAMQALEVDVPSWGNWVLNPGSTALTYALSLREPINSNLPKRYKTCVVKILGDKNSDRSAMTNAAMGVLNSRLAGSVLIGSATSELLFGAIANDSENSVTVQGTKRWSISFPGSAIQLGAMAGSIAGQLVSGTLVPADAFFAGLIAQTEEMATPGGQLVLTRQRAGTTVNPGFYSDNGTPNNPKGVRGTWTANQSLANIVTAALTTIGNQPTNPT